MTTCNQILSQFLLGNQNQRNQILGKSTSAVKLKKCYPVIKNKQQNKILVNAFFDANI